MKRSLAYNLKKDKILILMALPAILFYFIMNYIPMGGIIIAFKQYKYDLGIFGSPWVGFENFRFFFISGQAFNVTKNTVLYNLAFIIINNTLQIVMAICLSELVGKYFKKLTQSFMFLPYFISWVTAAASFNGFFNYEFGIVNAMLKSFNFLPIEVYNNVDAWKYILVIANIWKNVGYGTIYYLAAITSIDAEMYEAAEIDGANIFQRIKTITIPCLVPTIVILILLSIGNIFRGDFGLFYQLTGNNPLLYQATDIIDTFVFRALMQTREEGMAAAVGLFQSVLGFITIMLTNFCVKKYNKDYSLF
jgi:putative aldouronate transport system permease protein